MHDKTIKEIASEITTLQSKLSLLRSELYRNKAIKDADRSDLEAELNEIEQMIDALQHKYRKRKGMLS